MPISFHYIIYGSLVGVGSTLDLMILRVFLQFDSLQALTRTAGEIWVLYLQDPNSHSPHAPPPPPLPPSHPAPYCFLGRRINYHTIQMRDERLPCDTAAPDRRMGDQPVGTAGTLRIQSRIINKPTQEEIHDQDNQLLQRKNQYLPGARPKVNLVLPV